MPRTFVIDSGGTSRLVSKLFVVDSGSTTRQVRRAFVIDSSNTARLIYVAAQVIPASVSGSNTYPGAAEAIISFTTAGEEIAVSNADPGGLVLGNWLPGGSTSGYQIKATLSSGTAPNYPGATNTLNTWIPASSTLYWGLQQTSVGSASCALLFQISDNSGASVLASGTIDLSVSVSH